jgi:hypothetical protein
MDCLKKLLELGANFRAHDVAGEQKTIIKVVFY